MKLNKKIRRRNKKNNSDNLIVIFLDISKTATWCKVNEEVNKIIDNFKKLN